VHKEINKGMSANYFYYFFKVKLIQTSVLMQHKVYICRQPKFWKC